MIGLLAVGAWLVFGPLAPPKITGRPGSTLIDAQIGTMKGMLETFADPATGAVTFRFLWRDGSAPRELTREELERVLGPDAAHLAAETGPRNWLLSFLNITSWTNLAWISIGLAGQIAFSGRMIYQWWVSEKHQQSIVPTAFWWMSLGGGICLFSYFCWRQDFVGILGQAPGVVVYARNLWLIYRPRRTGLPAIPPAG
jgi:lipid-A-disaccharide synthase-like uncharacterized protein